ncbi:hypothetical protein OF83DRAFT_1082832 [Amylostereum chailletii]|nr:hypothetical protein OF83DRAFT_1082832 [Amylostereum chailletii]
MSVECTGPMPTSEFIMYFLAEPRSKRLSFVQFNLEKPSEGNQSISLDSSALCPSVAFSSSPPNNVPSNTPEELAPCFRLYGGPISHHSESLAPQLVDLLIDYVPVDPFRDPGPEVQDRQDVNFERTSPKARCVFNSHFAAIQAIFASHPRVSLLSIIVTDQGARLLRWDRAGVVVTERFDHNATDSPLADFLWRFDSMSPEQRGHDVSFSQPTLQDISIARDALSRSIHTPISPDAPLYKMSIIDDVSSQEFFFIVSTPQACNDRVHGNASRGYLAVDVRDGSLVWLKDVWRDDHPSSFKEGDTYRKLADKQIPHVAPLVCAADVPFQVTRTQTFAEAPWTCIPPTPVGRVHYRLVLKVVGRPLSKFTSTRELSHAKAYKRLNILHGDISSGNVLITDDGHGLLIDWELAFDASVGRRGSVIGTWQFVSCRLMNDPAKAEHLLCDDLESFLYVLVYIVLLHRPTGAEDLIVDINDIYHCGMDDGSTYMIGRHKHSFLAGCTLRPDELVGSLPKPLTDLIWGLRRLFNYGLYAGKGYVTGRQRKDAYKALQTPRRVLGLFNNMLKRRAWPEDDGSVDAVKAFKERTGAYRFSGCGTGKRTLLDAFGSGSCSESSGSAKRARPS